MSNQMIGMPVLGGYLAAFWGGVALLTVFITSNTAPTAPTVKLKEAEVFTSTKLELEIKEESQDPDGDHIRYYYQWKKNGQIVEGLDRDTVAEKHLTAGDKWEAIVTPDDSTMGGSLCGLPWRECADIGKNAAVLQIEVKDSPPRPRIRFLNKDDREVTQITAGIDIRTRLGCIDPDEEKEKGRLAEKGTPVTPPPPGTPDPCTYTIEWVNVDAPPEPGTPNPYTQPVLPASATKAGQQWKAIVIATKDGVTGNPSESKIQIL